MCATIAVPLISLKNSEPNIVGMTFMFCKYDYVIEARQWGWPSGCTFSLPKIQAFAQMGILYLVLSGTSTKSEEPQQTSNGWRTSTLARVGKRWQEYRWPLQHRSRNAARAVAVASVPEKALQ